MSERPPRTRVKVTINVEQVRPTSFNPSMAYDPLTRQISQDKLAEMWEYIVKSVQNSHTPRIGDRLTTSNLRCLINAGRTVNIK